MVKKEIKLNLSFSKEELATPRIKSAIKNLVDLKLELQKYKPYLSVSQIELGIITKFSDFVAKAKYNNKTEFKGEVGKIKGKRLVLEY